VTKITGSEKSTVIAFFAWQRRGEEKLVRGEYKGEYKKETGEATTRGRRVSCGLKFTPP
jgi:hypothetical protein